MDTENKTKILVVDDDKSTLKLLEAILKTQDFDVNILDDGEKTLEKVRDFLPDLILLDSSVPFNFLE